ncbi:bifunctional (p)ppGpp synthetase/guanosine-3',5'-bis(diphosphate) 3'-pyrophosphohydrolase [bacterium]|nr:bifunctional (p)ppGpp synthetase/guanosine-3',5'-bis(diphosphate) 3'-pyrophosphohydrolase [bacterium]
MAKERSAQAGYQEADYLFEVICERLRRTQGQINLSRLRKAYELGITAHEGQMRKDGSPYITHPLEVAEICADLNMNEDAIIAAILHDTVEDTPVKLPQIRAQFGPVVANMVDSLTKIKKIDFFARFLGRDKASNQARNLQKLFIAMTRDSRVIVIKLADRLHNMQTMGSMPEHKRERISKETLEFYIPLARRLGLGQMVTELEDLVFMHLYPSTYEELKQAVDKLTLPRERLVEKMIDQLRSMLLQHGIRSSKIYGRRKHLYSIWQKMQRQGVDLDGIYDLLAIRIILDGSPEDCYKVLGLLHLAYKPIFHRFRDFIGSPKENGYQTLHTSVIGPEGTIVEAQIRTVEMDLEAEKGIAAHWNYKDTSPGAPGTEVAKDDTWMSFIRELAEAEVGTEEFVAQTRETLLTDQVLVLSPQGEVVDLPQGSTPIDFAYYIHTDLGHSIRAAKVNGISVPLDYRLRSGDVVEVVKGPEGDTLPRPEWLVMARSPKSLLKIRRHFKSLPAAERINIGRNLLRQQITKEGLYPLNLMANDKLLTLLKRLSVRSIDDLYDKVAQGIYECDEIIRELKEIHISKIAPEADNLSAAPRVEVGDGRTVSVEYTRLGLASELGISRQGGEALRIKSELMACCTPVPPDHIYGVLDRRERRMRIHRAECERLKQQMLEGELMALEWSSPRDHQFYAARLGVVSLNRVGLLFEVLRFLSQQNINIGGAQFDMSSQEASAAQYVRFELVVEVSDHEELQRCIDQIRSIDDVLEVNRIFHYQDSAPAAPQPPADQPPAEGGGDEAPVDGGLISIGQPRLPFMSPEDQGRLS